MSISQIESKIRSLQHDIEHLNRDLESEAKREAGYYSSIARTKKSITKNKLKLQLLQKNRE